MIPNPLLDGIFEIRLKSDFWLQQLFKNCIPDIDSRIRNHYSFFESYLETGQSVWIQPVSFSLEANRLKPN
jgi:hypothetical protein